MSQIYKVRFSKPKQSDWVEIIAESPGAAAQILHDEKLNTINSLYFIKNEWEGFDKNEEVYFALIEIEGFEELVSRMFYSCIRRKGFRRKRSKEEIKAKLAEIANNLGYTHDPMTLLDPWDLEESEEDAIKRSYST